MVTETQRQRVAREESPPPPLSCGFVRSAPTSPFTAPTRREASHTPPSSAPVSIASVHNDERASRSELSRNRRRRLPRREFYERAFQLRARELDSLVGALPPYLLPAVTDGDAADGEDSDEGSGSGPAAAKKRLFLLGQSEGGMVVARYYHPELEPLLSGRVVSAWSCETNYFSTEVAAHDTRMSSLVDRSSEVAAHGTGISSIVDRSSPPSIVDRSTVVESSVASSIVSICSPPLHHIAHGTEDIRSSSAPADEGTHPPGRQATPSDERRTELHRPPPRARATPPCSRPMPPRSAAPTPRRAPARPCST